jgi:CheY-like chemotaxis protein
MSDKRRDLQNERRRLTLLFADRDLEWSRELRVRLSQRGARVFAAWSGRRLVELVRRFQPDLIMMDGDLDPVGVGALVRLIHHHHPAATVAVTTKSRTIQLIYGSLPPGAAQRLGRRLVKWVLGWPVWVEVDGGQALRVDAHGSFLLRLGQVLKRQGSKRLSMVMLSSLQEKGGLFYAAKPCEPRAMLYIVDYLLGDAKEAERELLKAGHQEG